MSENNYYKDNIFKRSLRSIGNFFKQAPTMKFDAVAGAIGFFVILVALLEYKVFQSMYQMTGDIVLTASALVVTAFGGVYAEIVMHRNDKATDDQNMYADWIFHLSLVTSAFIGLGAWMNASGLSSFDIGDFTLTLPKFHDTCIAIITLVTVVDILVIRAYFRADVTAVHRRNIARSNSKKTQADLQVEDKLIEFEAAVKSQTEQILRVEARRKEVRQELQSLYGGRVPDDVMKNAMSKLDEIMKEIKTGQDLNNDGKIGFGNTVTSFASDTKIAEPLDFTTGQGKGK